MLHERFDKKDLLNQTKLESLSPKIRLVALLVEKSDQLSKLE